MRPEFKVGTPYLTTELVIPGKDVYRIPGEPINQAALMLVADRGGVPSALAVVWPNAGVGKADIEAAAARIQELVDEAVRDVKTAAARIQELIDEAVRDGSP